MDLRPELLPPAVAPERITELGHEIERIADLILHAHRDEAAEAITAFNTATGHAYSTIDFTEYDGWRSLSDFAKEAARPARPRVPDIDPSELAEIVRRIRTSGPDTDYYVRLFETNTLAPDAASLIFNPPEHLEDASAEEIVAAALAHRPIAL